MENLNKGLIIKLRKFIKKFNFQRGNVTILSITITIVLIVFTPFIIDVAILFKTRADAKSASDAASLAAAQEILFLEDGENVAKAIAEKNNAKLVSYFANNNEVIVTTSKIANFIFIDNFIKGSIEIKATSSSEVKFPWGE
ncbi:MAG: hypothetical protein KKC53_00095 [Actinobacteria bacterium]|nr:hypothetical protein [Actinomycetota bacterium]